MRDNDVTTSDANHQDSKAAPGRILCRIADDVLTITISNPKRLNALSVDMWHELRRAFSEAGKSERLRCIVLEGEGEKAFSAGADITEFGTTRATFEQVVRFHEDTVGACLKEIGDCPIPVVAKIRGVCMGGGLELASVCDIRIADEAAQFGAPVGKLGFPLALGETQALFDLVGGAVAAELLIEGRVLNCLEAQSRGIVTRLSPSLSLDAEVERAVASICQSGIWAARSHKRQLRRLMRDASPVSEQERKEVYAFVHTEEYKKGIERFVRRKKT